MNYFRFSECFKNCTPSEIANACESKFISNNILELLSELNDIRGKLGLPITVTSWYRDEEHNERAGGVSNSQHLNGSAADIKCSDMNFLRGIFRELAQEDYPYLGQVIFYGTFIHVALPGSTYKKLTICYDQTYYNI